MLIISLLPLLPLLKDMPSFGPYREILFKIHVVLETQQTLVLLPQIDLRLATALSLLALVSVASVFAIRCY